MIRVLLLPHRRQPELEHTSTCMLRLNYSLTRQRENRVCEYDADMSHIYSCAVQGHSLN